jgi:hypothetical protein
LRERKARSKWAISLTLFEKPTWKFEPLAFGGQVNLWLDLIEGPDGLMPPKDEYVFGADIAAGTGGEWSSYSALEGLNKKTGEQVFEFRTNRMDPIQFGDCAYG